MGRLENFKQRGRNRATKKRNPFVVIACEGNNKLDLLRKLIIQVKKYKQMLKVR